MPPMERKVPKGSGVADHAVPFSPGRNNQQNKRHQRAEQSGHHQGEQRADQADPGSEHGDELNVAQAEAFAVAQEPVEPAGEEQEAGGEQGSAKIAGEGAQGRGLQRSLQAAGWNGALRAPSRRVKTRPEEFRGV